MSCLLKIGFQARCLVSALLPLGFVLFGVNPAWSASVIVLKDGTRVEATSKPVCMEGQYRFNDIRGQFRTIPITQIDLRATEEANKGIPSARSMKANHVLTNEDIAEKPSTSSPLSNRGQVTANPPKTSTNKGISTPVASNQQAEDYWRKRASDLRAKMDRIDKAITDLDTKMKSGKSDGIKIDFDTYTPVILAHFGDQMKSLQQEKEKLQLQMNALEEEARKAGAQPGWLR